VLQEQYIFVYDALLEALKAGKTVIGCSDLKPEFDKLCVVDASCGKSKLQQQYEVSLIVAFYKFIQQVCILCKLGLRILTIDFAVNY